MKSKGNNAAAGRRPARDTTAGRKADAPSAAKKERKPVTMRLDLDVIDYFKAEADRTGIPYQNLINLYLQECVAEGKTLRFA
ncbi:MAG: antitoxin [Eggerthellaceae bacterium]|nr:antitoxin [Eggerthellaceae bacterium]